MSNFKSIITTESIGDKIYELIKEQIIKGKLLPGERLKEVDLSNKLNVSRTPLREALKRLEIEGWVFRHSRGILRVSDISLKEAKDLYAVREVLEGLLVRKATKHIKDEEIEELKRIIQNMEAVAKVNDTNLVVRYGKEFHCLLYKVSRNQKCLDILADVNNYLERYRYLGVDSIAKRGSQAVKEHKAILEAVEKRDYELAERVTREHIREGSAAVIAVLEGVIDTLN